MTGYRVCGYGFRHAFPTLPPQHAGTPCRKAQQLPQYQCASAIANLFALLSASVYICIPEKTGNMDKIRNQYLPLKDEGYNCFACAPWNPCGLKMEFYEDGDEVVSLWTPSDNYQGWFKTLHGGIQATLIDEVSGWFVNRKLQLAGMTTNLNIRYRKSIPTGADEKIEIRVRLKEMRRNLAVLEGRILHGTQLCTTAEITFFTFDEKTSREQFHFDGCRLEKECEEGCGQ